MAVNFNSTFSFSSLPLVQSAQQNAFTCYFPCPDQLVGYISKGVFNSYMKRTSIDYNVQNGTISNTLVSPIIIVLESPHKYEFDPITKAVLGPAMGETGKNFSLHFMTALSKSKNFSFYANGQHHDIILLNSVQYQCSLGDAIKPNRTRTNNIWQQCFQMLNTDFSQRIRAINPTAVINLCTKTLSSKVQTELNKILQPNRYTSGTHPCSWTNAINAIIN